MANIKQLKHLEHLEDEMLNYGVEGCDAAVSFLKELRKMLGQQESTGFMQTKWDGAPSVVCGVDPLSGVFFVGTKSVFAKNAKLNFKYSSTEPSKSAHIQNKMTTKENSVLRFIKKIKDKLPLKLSFYDYVLSYLCPHRFPEDLPLKRFNKALKTIKSK